MLEPDIVQILNEQFSVKLSPLISDEELQKKLAPIINDLIENDFKKLIYILYKVDISEVKLKLMLRDNPETAAEIIALLIIERQKEKLKSRKNFPSRNDIPEDEKW